MAIGGTQTFFITIIESTRPIGRSKNSGPPFTTVARSMFHICIRRHMFPKQFTSKQIICTVWFPRLVRSTIRPRTLYQPIICFNSPSTTNTRRFRYVAEHRRRGDVTTDRRFDTNPSGGVRVATPHHDENFPGFAAQPRRKVIFCLFEQRRGRQRRNGAWKKKKKKKKKR